MPFISLLVLEELSSPYSSAHGSGSCAEQTVATVRKRILYRRKASNSRPSPWSDARSYQHKAVGELHRQKAGMFSLLQSIDALVQELQVRLAAFQYVVLDGHCYQSIEFISIKS